MTTYKVFKRRPWRRNASWPGGWEPAGDARKTTVRRGATLDEARRICREANARNVPGKPGQIYCEFTAEGP